jgi:hypothetical protein
MVRAILEGRKTSTKRVVKLDKYRPNWMGNYIDGTQVGGKSGTISGIAKKEKQDTGY